MFQLGFHKYVSVPHTCPVPEFLLQKYTQPAGVSGRCYRLLPVRPVTLRFPSPRSLFSTCPFSTPNALRIWQFGCTVVICSSNHKIVSTLIILSHRYALFWSLPFSLIFTEVSVLISNWKILWSICAVWHILSRVTVHATIIKGSLVFLSEALQFMGF